MAGRFNKLLELIGLVDDEPEDDFDQGQYNRPASGQTYGAQQNRRPAPPPPSRGRAPMEFDEPRSNGRYNSSARPDYDARQRRDSYSQQPPRYPSDAQRYPSDARSSRDTGSTVRDYDRGYRSSGNSDGYRAMPRVEQQGDEGMRRSARPAQTPPPNNVVPMRTSTQSQTVIYYLRKLEDCRDVINDLLENKTVLLNLEDMDQNSVQRGIDTLCGAAFALGADLRKASDKTYLIAPSGVNVASTNDAGRHYD